MASNKSDQFQTAAIKFLENDFNQCFQQLRYYDGQIFEIIKYSFVVYSGLLGIALTLYKIGLDNKKDFVLPALALLVIGLIFGFYLFALVVRNRVYFVLVTRYVNEHRGFFLSKKPLGFQNQTKMYKNFSQPPYFNWCSSQSWFMYLMAFLNSTLMGALIYIISERNNLNVLDESVSILGSLVALFFVQVIVAIIYLISREKKSASKAVFGKE